ncbi:MAG: hypothetical protein AAGE59_09675 [Cyanobacteria bacterium P01_F01_bin.86]
MPHTSLRLSEIELSQRILEMACTGVYRESIFEAFQSLATKQQIRSAITHAKQFGLYSVRNLRDSELGTYYQVDTAKYQSFQAALKASVPLTSEDDLAARIVASTQAVQALLAIAGSCAIGFLIVGGFCLVTGHLQSGRLAWVSAASMGAIWFIQRTWVRSFL